MQQMCGFSLDIKMQECYKHLGRDEMRIITAESNIMEWFCFVFLGLSSYLDLRYKIVRVNWCRWFALFCVLYQVGICHTGIGSIAGGAVLGVIVWILSYITKEAIGRGDGILLSSLGMGLGFRQGMQVFMLGLFFIMLAGIILVTIKKISLKERIPFVPFLFLGEAVLLLCEIF